MSPTRYLDSGLTAQMHIGAGNGCCRSRPANPELEPVGGRGPCARTSAGADAAEKEELCLCGDQVVDRGSIPNRSMRAIVRPRQE